MSILDSILGGAKAQEESSLPAIPLAGKDESLKEYMLRFNRVKLEVEKVNDETMLSALMNGIKMEGPLMAELARKKKLVTLPQFISKAEEFINQEEMVRSLLKSKTKIHLAKSSSGKAVPESSRKRKKEEKMPPKKLQKKGESQR